MQYIQKTDVFKAKKDLEQRLGYPATIKQALFSLQRQVAFDHQVHAQAGLNIIAAQVAKSLIQGSDDDELVSLIHNNEVLSAPFAVAEDKVSEVGVLIKGVSKLTDINTPPTLALSYYYDREEKESRPLHSCDDVETLILDTMSKEQLMYAALNAQLVELAKAVKFMKDAGVYIPEHKQPLLNKFGSPSWGAVLSGWFWVALGKFNAKHKMQSVSKQYLDISQRVAEADDKGEPNTTYDLERLDYMSQQYDQLKAAVKCSREIEAAEQIVVEFNRVAKWGGIDFDVTVEVVEQTDEEVKDDIDSLFARAEREASMSAKPRGDGASIRKRLAESKEV